MNTAGPTAVVVGHDRGGGGEWRTAALRQRYFWPDGRIALRVEVRLPAGDGTPTTVIRTYWLDHQAMRPAGSDDGRPGP